MITNKFVRHTEAEKHGNTKQRLGTFKSPQSNGHNAVYK